MNNLEELYTRNKTCCKCKNLCRTRTQVVPGIGPLDAKLFFCGEAPGQNEDVEGEPFVGRAGDLFDKILKDLGIARSSCYITNTINCRPTLENLGQKDRQPSKEEIQNCKRWLWDKIKIVKPKVIVTLGKTSTRLLLKLPENFAMSNFLGKVHNVPYMDTVVIPAWHPSYLLRTGKTEYEQNLEAIRTAKRLLNE